jgi:chromosome segregation ATPase
MFESLRKRLASVGRSSFENHPSKGIEMNAVLEKLNSEVRDDERSNEVQFQEMGRDIVNKTLDRSGPEVREELRQIGKSWDDLTNLVNTLEERAKVHTEIVAGDQANREHSRLGAERQKLVDARQREITEVTSKYGKLLSEIDAKLPSLQGVISSGNNALARRSSLFTAAVLAKLEPLDRKRSSLAQEKAQIEQERINSRSIGQLSKDRDSETNRRLKDIERQLKEIQDEYSEVEASGLN